MQYNESLGWIITLQEWKEAGFSDRQYKYLKNKLQLTNKPAKGKPVGIVVRSLPEQYRTIIEQRIVQLANDHQQLMLEARLQHTNLTEAAVRITANTLKVNAPYIVSELSEYIDKQHGQYIGHYLQSYNLSRNSIVGYAKLCAIAQWVYNIVTLLKSQYTEKRDYNRQMRSFRANFAEAMHDISHRLEVRIPASRRLDDWIDYVVQSLAGGKQVTDIITPKRVGNTNSQVITAEQRLAIERLYADPSALSIMEIYNKLIETGRLMGWWRDAAGNYDPPSYGTIRRYIVQKKNILKASRTSSEQYRNAIVPTINRHYPDRKNMIWGIDGTAQNEYVHYRGKVRQYAYAVLVYDYGTFRLLNIGITLGPNETADILIDTLKGAIREAGYKPAALQCDHGPGFNGLKTWCEANGIKVIPAGLGIARAKPVELLIGLKDRLVDRFNASWSGGNRTAKGDNSHPGAEQVKAGQRGARSFELLKANLAREVMQQWNHYVIATREGQPCGLTPTELWNKLESDTPKLDTIQLAMLCGVKHTVKLTIDGLTVQNGGQRYLYFPPIDTDEDLDRAYEVFAEIPRTGHRQGSQLDIYILDYGKPAPVFKGNKYYGMWTLKPRADMFATITKNTANYTKLRKFQQLFIGRTAEQLEQIEQQYQVQPYAPIIDELKTQPLTGRKRVVPLMDKSALNADEIMAKSGEELPDPVEQISRELANDNEYELRQYTNTYTGEIITIKVPKNEK